MCLLVCCPSLPVTEAVWLAAVADVVGGPGFVHVAKAALGTWRVERQKSHNIASWKSLCDEKEKSVFWKEKKKKKTQTIQWWLSIYELYLARNCNVNDELKKNGTILRSWGWCQCQLPDSYSKHINIWIVLIAVRKLVFVWTWDAAVGSWEVGVGAGRLWRTSSGGGTGKTTGEALDGSLFTSKTSMGPVELLRRIWYFLCPLRTWMRTQDPVWDTRHNSSWTNGAFKARKPHI